MTYWGCCCGGMCSGCVVRRELVCAGNHVDSAEQVPSVHLQQEEHHITGHFRNIHFLYCSQKTRSINWCYYKQALYMHIWDSSLSHYQLLPAVKAPRSDAKYGESLLSPFWSVMVKYIWPVTAHNNHMTRQSQSGCISSSYIIIA